jgi:hypothetical protein
MLRADSADTTGASTWDDLTRALDAPDRSRIEAVIEGLIGYLDTLDTDPDLEPSSGYLPPGISDEAEPDHDDERTLGWADNAGQGTLGDNTDDGDITALERHGKGFCRSGPDDAEPSLGWAIGVVQVSSRFFGGTNDLEDDHDREPSLGWHGGNHGGPVVTCCDDLDREEDDAEMGIGDADGLAEQTTGEPSLGSFDRMTNQEKSWKQRFNSSNWHAGNDAELDDADREDSDPAEDDGTAEDDLRRLPRVVWDDTGQPVTFLFGR